MKRWMTLAAVAAALTLTGCGGGGSSSSAAAIPNPGIVYPTPIDPGVLPPEDDDEEETPVVNNKDENGFNTSTVLTIDGQLWYEATASASGDTPPSPPTITR